MKINELIKVANKAGYRTYLKSTTEPMPMYGGGITEKTYTLAGESWETPWTITD
jgi:hypothetical protein